MISKPAITNFFGTIIVGLHNTMGRSGKLFVYLVGIFTTAFWYFVIREIFNRPVPNLNFLGAAILILGALLIIFHRVIGKKFFTQATSFGLDSTKSLWINFGELNTQKLYLIIGIITILAGTIILLSNTLYR